MDETAFPFGFFWMMGFVVGWLALVTTLSIWVRKANGKPIFPRAPANALFAERGASGGMASNCLLVAVTDDALVVTPTFPFNLCFLPQIYGLEHDIPARSIKGAYETRGAWGKNVAIAYGEKGRELRLKVRDPEGLVTALRRLTALPA